MTSFMLQVRYYR